MRINTTAIIRFCARTLIWAFIALLVYGIYMSGPGRGRQGGAATRSRVSRVLADLRELRTAVESYAVDNGAYPRMSWGDCYANDWKDDTSTEGDKDRQRIWGTLTIGFGETPDDPRPYGGSVTSPISYITTVFFDPFATPVPKTDISRLGGYYMYWNVWQYKGMLEAGEIKRAGGRFPYAPRADQIELFAETFGTYVIVSAGPRGWDDVVAGRRPLFLQFDPTNGTMSAGSIFVSQKSQRPAWVDAFALEP